MRGRAMGSYQWCLVGPDDQVIGVMYADCPNYSDAMMRAERILHQRRDLSGVDVWDESKRLVGRAPPVEAEGLPGILDRSRP
jgi:hypothetical protein